jgi:hypothetical protein
MSSAILRRSIASRGGTKDVTFTGEERVVMGGWWARRKVVLFKLEAGHTGAMYILEHLTTSEVADGGHEVRLSVDRRDGRDGYFQGEDGVK